MMDGVVHALRVVDFEWVYLWFAASLLGGEHWWLGGDIELNGLIDFADETADSTNEGFGGLLSGRSFGFWIFLSGTIFHA